MAGLLNPGSLQPHSCLAISVFHPQGHGFARKSFFAGTWNSSSEEIGKARRLAHLSQHAPRHRVRRRYSNTNNVGYLHQTHLRNSLSIALKGRGSQELVRCRKRPKRTISRPGWIQYRPLEKEKPSINWKPRLVLT